MVVHHALYAMHSSTLTFGMAKLQIIIIETILLLGEHSASCNKIVFFRVSAETTAQGISTTTAFPVNL